MAYFSKLAVSSCLLRERRNYCALGALRTLSFPDEFLLMSFSLCLC
jgi:hypothetical protein